MKRPFVAAALTMLAAAVSYTNYRRYRRRKREACAAAAPPHIQDWETEGGGVPVDTGHTAATAPTAAQVTPDPTVVVKSAVQEARPDLELGSETPALTSPRFTH